MKAAVCTAHIPVATFADEYKIVSPTMAGVDTYEKLSCFISQWRSHGLRWERKIFDDHAEEWLDGNLMYVNRFAPYSIEYVEDVPRKGPWHIFIEERNAFEKPGWQSPQYAVCGKNRKDTSHNATYHPGWRHDHPHTCVACAAILDAPQLALF